MESFTNPTRITVPFNKLTTDLLEKISAEAGASQSEIMRLAIKFYSENKALEDPQIKKKIRAYQDMLLSGEHVIVDVDHWHMFLRLIASSPKKDQFWKEHRDVARAHWEQLKTQGSLNRRHANSPRNLQLLSASQKRFQRLYLGAGGGGFEGVYPHFP